jgi:hypothetical protein
MFRFARAADSDDDHLTTPMTLPMPCAVANPALALQLQACPLVGRVAELGSLIWPGIVRHDESELGSYLLIIDLTREKKGLWNIILGN